MNGWGSSSSSAYPPATDVPAFNAVPAEKWIAGEAPISRILSCVRPTLDSEEKRKAVVDYMRQLIKNFIGVEVFHYGSVPLKAYLPDGDIDITIFSVHEPERNFCHEVLEILMIEQQIGNNGFMIQEIRYVDAEVKLVKCLVDGLTIDVSFNQLSGLCAQSFLERVDGLIGNNHLFKRSIILIKSWCYYESRILGSTHGLLSTYALETLILCIFRMYGTSLTSPLKVLYMFLEYYSKFDWENFCITIDGPVYKYSVPYIVNKKPMNNRVSDGDCLRDYIDMFTLPCKRCVKNLPPFSLKFINIIDALKANNNLGRSVHMGTSFRIQYALDFGAHKLREILNSPIENIQEGLKKFFCNTLERNQPKALLNPRLTFDTLSTSSITEVHYEDEDEYYESEYEYEYEDEYEYEYEDENSNVDIDSSVNDNGKSLEGFDLSALCLVLPADEEGGQNANENANANTKENLDNGNGEEGGQNANENANANTKENLDNGNGEVADMVEESENMTLADLSGDYDASVRDLVISECFTGFPKSHVVLHGPVCYSPPVGFQQNFTHVQSFVPNGSMMMPRAQDFTFHGARQFVPPKNPHRANGKGHVQHFTNRQLNQTRRSTYETGSSSSANSNGPRPQSAQGAVAKERKLEFGSFDGTVSVTNSEPAETYYLCDRRQERVPDKTWSLKDENEFPPLSG